MLVEFSPALRDGVEGLTLGLGDVWLNLADARGGGRLFTWADADLDWRAGLTVPVVLCAFPRAFEARSVDGWGNNRDHPELGVPGTPLLRGADVSSVYGLTGAPPRDLPGPREVSNLVSAQDGPAPNSYGVTDMVWQWGQFLDHDLSLTPQGLGRESLPIPIPQRDPAFNPFLSGATMPFSRSMFDPSSGVSPGIPRTPVNTITAFIDASNVYGSDPARTRALRTNDGTGMLRTTHDGRLLRYNDDFLPNDDGNRGRSAALFLAGDIRANEQVGLTSMHALFVREHNRLAGIIAAENPSLMGQEIFELARKIVGALMQAITYNEFLPVLLGPGALGPYEGYDPRVDPGIANEFSTAAFRFGHTMLSPSLLHIDESGRHEEFSLATAFFNPELVKAEGISGFLRGLAIQQAQEIDPLLVDEVRNMLFGAPGGPVRDLAALNIQRTRDHGLADYNTTRMAYGLPPVQDFGDVSPNPDTVEALRAVYGEIGYLDLWVGGLAEDHLPGALVGETFHAILVDQFRRLRDGDRYWYEHDPFFVANLGLLFELRSTTLADVIRRNTPIGDELPDRVFGGPPPAAEPRGPCIVGDVAPGSSLVAYEGGTVADLDACARSLGITALYARFDGRYVPYLLDAPAVVNRAFGALFAEGVPPLAQLVVRSPEPSEGAGGDGE